MRLFGLIGYPLGHSFSKKYFTEKFEREGIADCRFELFPIPEVGYVRDVAADHPELVGLSVTIPYKEQVLPFLDDLGDTASIGACNCIHIRDRRWYGYNTDVVGFRESFRRLLTTADRRALILGTGGASKAVVSGLRQLGVEFRYVSRNPKDPSVLRYEDLGPDVMAQYSAIINASPVGTFPNVDAAPPIPYELVSSRHYLFDLVYNPEMTRFLREGQERGARICNGWDMLVIQAEANWVIWNA